MNYSVLDHLDLPIRHCTELKKTNRASKYSSVKEIVHDTKLKNEQKPLVDTMLDEMTYRFIGSEAEEPSVNLVFHDKRDGVVAAKCVYDRLATEVPEAVFNPDINEKKLSSFIKPASIKRAAREKGIWNGKEGYSIKDFKAAFISVISSIAGFIFLLFDLNGIFNFSVNFAGDEHTLTGVFALLAAVLGVFAVVSFILVRREHFERDIANFEQMIAEDEDDTRYLKLLSALTEEDFSAFPSGTKQCVYVVNLSETAIYTPRERKAIQHYLSVMEAKQCWFVFLETIPESEPMLKIERARIFSVVRLGMKKKRALAQQVFDRTGSMIYDSMLGYYGVDAILEKLLEMGTSVADKKMLENKVDEFAAKYRDDNIVVKRLVYFVADLAQKYRINFEKPSLWKYLFTYTGKNSNIEGIDKRLVCKLFFKDPEIVKDGHYNRITDIIAEIFREFSDCFYNLSENNPYSPDGEYLQLCLMKAMGVQNQDDYRLSTVATSILDNIYDCYRLVHYDGEYGAICDFNNGEWGNVILYALTVFETENYRWFSPEIVHAFLMLYEAVDEKNRPVGILSRREFLVAARSNLILGPNIHGGEAGDSELQVSYDGIHREIDPLYDHYLTVKYAVGELHLSEKSTFGNTPACFDIIRMTAAERDEYYIALSRLEEKSVIAFLENLYDTFSVCSSVQSTIRFCSTNLYRNRNKIESKYNLGEGKYTSDLDYVSLILDRMFVILEGTYSNDARILARVRELHEMYRSNERNIEELLLLELAESEFVGISLFSYLICMAARIKGNRHILENMYLGIGNYLVRLIFLIYHESAINSLNNSDFKYMALILGSYYDPGEAVLGYICWCSSQLKTGEATKLVDAYLVSHTDNCVDNLDTVVDSLTVTDFQGFISYVFSAGYLDNPQKERVLSKIVTVLKSRFTYDSHIALCIELATVISSGEMTDEFAALSNDELAERLRSASPNSIYILVSRYMRMDKARYYPLCASLVQEILSSTIVGKSSLLIDYFYYVMQNESEREQFVATLVTAVSTWNNTLRLGYRLSYNSASAAGFVRFFRACLTLDYVGGDLKDVIAHALELVLAEHGFFLELESNENFFMRSWEKMSIVNLLIYLLEHSALHSVNSSWCAQLSEEERREAIAASAYSERPLIYVGDEYCVNRKYIDILRAIAQNDNDVQSVIEEDSIIDKLLSDANDVVERVFEDSVCKNVKQKLHRISSAYRRF